MSERPAMTAERGDEMSDGTLYAWTWPALNGLNTKTVHVQAIHAELMRIHNGKGKVTMSDDTRQAQAIDAVAKSAIAALAKVLAYARSGQTAMTPDEYWGYLHESYRPDYVRQARLMLESAFAVAPPERHDAPGVSMSREDAEQLVDDYCGLENQRRRLISLLTGQPDAEQCIHRIGAPACRKGLGCGCMRGEAPELPDAGRDPDAADAGGGANDG